MLALVRRYRSKTHILFKIDSNLMFDFKKLLESSGNLYDACALAAKFALAKARFPSFQVKSDDEGRVEIDINDQHENDMQLNVSHLPYSISVCKIGNSFVVDADLKEESVTKVRVTFGFDSNSQIRYTSKDGFGSLDPDTLYSIVDVILLSISI